MKFKLQNSNFKINPKFQIKKFGFRQWDLFWILILGCWILTSCSTSYDARGVFHRTREGETLVWVAKAYGVELQDLAEMNNIQQMNQELVPGEKLYIPSKKDDRYKKLPFEKQIAESLEGSSVARRGKKKISKENIYTDHDRFIWPVPGKVMSPFGIRHGRRHDGIDIKAGSGTIIRAADNGKVVYAGSMRGYGNLILVRHKDDFFTAYAHNKKNGVKEGKKVKKGEMIGQVGRTGRATGSHLHFEVREGEKARNPLFFLPPN